MQIQFQLSLDDYLAAQRLHSTGSSWLMFQYVLIYFISPIFGLIFLIIDLLHFEDKASNHYHSATIIYGILLVCIPIIMRIHLKRCYKRTRTDNNESKFTFGEERIEIEGQYINGAMDWRAVKSYRENDKVFILYSAPARFSIIPKRACTDEQISELRTILRQKIQPEIVSK